METFVIEAQHDFGVIIAGPLAAAVCAAGDRSARPLRNIHINGYGAVHARMTTDVETLRAWWDVSHDRGPGALLFFLGLQRQPVDAGFYVETAHGNKHYGNEGTMSELKNDGLHIADAFKV